MTLCGFVLSPPLPAAAAAFGRLPMGFFPYVSTPASRTGQLSASLPATVARRMLKSGRSLSPTLCKFRMQSFS